MVWQQVIKQLNIWPFVIHIFTIRLYIFGGQLLVQAAPIRYLRKGLSKIDIKIVLVGEGY